VDKRLWSFWATVRDWQDILAALYSKEHRSVTSMLHATTVNHHFLGKICTRRPLSTAMLNHLLYRVICPSMNIMNGQLLVDTNLTITTAMINITCLLISHQDNSQAKVGIIDDKIEKWRLFIIEVIHIYLSICVLLFS